MKKAVVLINTGSIYAADRSEYLAFMRRFLSDINVVKLPLWLKPLLFRLILPLRSSRILSHYKSIFTDKGNPYFIYTQNLVDTLNKATDDFDFYQAQSYSSPFLKDVLVALKAKGYRADDIIFIPLYPQYCRATTQAAMSLIKKTLREVFVNISEPYNFHCIKSYCFDNAYIKALAASFKDHSLGDHIIFTYHSMLKESIASGDSYQKECEYTTQSVCKALMLNPNKISHTYQSPAGLRQAWLGPFLDERLIELAKYGIKHVTVIAPTFSIDCLETLYEIKIENQKRFIEHGGQRLEYIAALNDSNDHADLILHLLQKYTEQM